jgi:two-component SAPR family response regulator
MTARPDSTTTLGGRRVLIVEDQYLIADDMRQAIEALGGAAAGPAPTVATALEMLAGGEVDLALLDVNIAGEPVYVLAEALAEQGKPFIFATGYSRVAIPPKYADAPHLEKPLTREALSACIGRLGPPKRGIG